MFLGCDLHQPAPLPSKVAGFSKSQPGAAHSGRHKGSRIGGSPIAFERSQPPQTLYFQALGRCRGAIQISAPGHSGCIILWHGDLYTDRPAHASFFSITQRFSNSRFSWGSPAPVSPVMFPFSILFYLLLFIQMQRASSGRTNEQILAA